MLSVVSNIVDTLVEGLSAFLSGIGNAVISFLEAIFINRAVGVDTILNTADDVLTLTTFGTVLLAFMGIAVAYWVVGLVLSVIRR